MKSVEERRIFLLGVLMAVATLALYWPVTGYDYVGLDDDLYVYENPWVRTGLCWTTLKWALTATFSANWHPLTWMSHLLDTSLYGPDAGGPHLTNVVLHALNSLLLFLVLARLTGSSWPSLMVAALFAWHPLHVESVAWISERKDLLSMLWWTLAIWAYARGINELKGQSPSGKSATYRVFYVLAILFFALGLMSKPMVVTLPFVLLLLDYWPLNRWQAVSERQGSPAPRRIGLPLLVEKLPFFVLALAGCVVTVIAQHAGGAVKSFTEVPLYLRAINVPVAYASYIGKTLWPDHLCAFYPLPAKPLFLPAIGAGLALAGISGLLVRLRRQYPWLAVGWFWFLGTLVPVIGLVQVGSQAMADRYMYIPSIGLFIMAAWSVNHCLISRPRARTLGCAVVALCLLCCALATQWQMACWRDSFALFTRILSLTKDCGMAQNDLGIALSRAGRREEAIYRFKEALRITPSSAGARYNLGIELAGAGKLDEAMVQFSEALKLNSHNEQLHNNAGVVLAQQGKVEQALDHFKAAIQLNPQYPKPYLNSARAWETLGNFGEAVTNYGKALQLEPDSAETLDRFALLLAACRDSKWRNPAGAVELARRANKLTRSEEPDYLATLATAYAAAGQYSNAVTTAELARRRAAAHGLGTLAAKIATDLQFYKAGHIAPPKAQ
jgi:tetratricopeptide (TPR) repeat protein